MPSPAVAAMRSFNVSRSFSGVSCKKPSQYSTSISPRSDSTSSQMVLQAMILTFVISLPNQPVLSR